MRSNRKYSVVVLADPIKFDEVGPFIGTFCDLLYNQSHQLYHSPQIDMLLLFFYLLSFCWSLIFS